MFLLHQDGYIRLTQTQLQGISLAHLISGLDEDAPSLVPAGASQTAITGYTEWVSLGSPAIAVGWDWQMNMSNDQVQLERISDPRSNIMLKDDSEVDMGQTKSLSLLGGYIDTLNWQPETFSCIDARYGK